MAVRPQVKLSLGLLYDQENDRCIEARINAWILWLHVI